MQEETQKITRPLRLLTVGATSITGITASILACVVIFLTTETLAYRIVVIYLTVILVSNFLAKAVTEYLRYKT